MGSYSLTAHELASLQALTLGSVRSRINSTHALKLAALGLIRETADGYVITSRGRALLPVTEGDLGAPLFIHRMRTRSFNGAKRVSANSAYSTFAPDS